ncbi:hypothetical protein L596_026425 [Steinernema carpocapsae]|uniref:Uncharacterized protein n=1 Tax=Steinernema carpocapsae TaxID=34508 RepID=A0A4U5M1B6_STECR|nr:hypothetical protein L596_026425 [Steinernema carpocapsae]
MLFRLVFVSKPLPYNGIKRIKPNRQDYFESWRKHVPYLQLKELAYVSADITQSQTNGVVGTQSPADKRLGLRSALC